jgi:hypothetical protein
MVSEVESGLQSGMLFNLFSGMGLHPSVFGRNLQCQSVREANTREECHWSHALKRFKRGKAVTRNGILESEVLPKTRTVPTAHIHVPNQHIGEELLCLQHFDTIYA